MRGRRTRVGSWDVFERFTVQARPVVVLARQEARALKRYYVGTARLSLGLLRESRGRAACIQATLDVTVERVREQVVQAVRCGDEDSPGQIPFTSCAKRVLELAMRETHSLGHNYVGTERTSSVWCARTTVSRSGSCAIAASNPRRSAPARSRWPRSPIDSVSECSDPCGGVGARERVWAPDEEKNPRRSPVGCLSTCCVRQGKLTHATTTDTCMRRRSNGDFAAGPTGARGTG